MNINTYKARLRAAQRRLAQATRKLERELRHPMIEVNCSCGYHSRMRRSATALPTRCPRCNGPIVYC